MVIYTFIISYDVYMHGRNRDLEGRHLDLGKTGDDSLLNSALVRSLDDAEESLLSPLNVPRVGNEPVGGSVLNSPSDDLDCVSSENLSGDVLVDSSGVLVEVLVDGECSLDGSVVEDLLLDGIDLLLDGVRRLSLELVVVVALGVGGVGAFGSALGGVGVDDSGAVVVVGGAIDGVGTAGLDGVRLAAGVLVESTASADSLLRHVSPGTDGVSTLASVSAEESTAREEIVGGEGRLLGSIGGNADTVGHGLGGSECPACSSVGLVTDGSDSLAGRPLLTSVESSREGGRDFGVDLEGGVSGQAGVLDGHQTVSVGLLRDLGLQKLLGVVDVVTERFSGDVECRLWNDILDVECSSGSHESQNEGEF
ncbi:hypothetical protein PFISCL1PPCAC_2214, partial [Pristionchus fissidentatus]